MGLALRSLWRFSVIYPRSRETGTPDIRGRLNLRYLKIHYEDARQFFVIVSSTGRAEKTYTFSSETPKSGVFSVPILSRNTETTISVATIGPLGASFSGYEWEGTFHTRLAGRG